jgi:hypothetical protein
MASLQLYRSSTRRVVECPQCGRTALAANLIAAYYERVSGGTVVVPG